MSGMTISDSVYTKVCGHRSAAGTAAHHSQFKKTNEKGLHSDSHPESDKIPRPDWPLFPLRRFELSVTDASYHHGSEIQATPRDLILLLTAPGARKITLAVLDLQNIGDDAQLFKALRDTWRRMRGWTCFFVNVNGLQCVEVCLF